MSMEKSAHIWIPVTPDSTFKEKQASTMGLIGLGLRIDCDMPTSSTSFSHTLSMQQVEDSKGEDTKKNTTHMIMVDDLLHSTPKPKTPKLDPALKRKYTRKQQSSNLENLSSLEQLPPVNTNAKTARRVLDFDFRVQDVIIPQKCWPSNNTVMQVSESITCHSHFMPVDQCCSCHVENLKPIFPREYKKIRSSRKRRMLPPPVTRKKRKRRVNRFTKVMAQWDKKVTPHQEGNPVCIEAEVLQQVNIKECMEPPKSREKPWMGIEIKESVRTEQPSLSTEGSENASLNNRMVNCLTRKFEELCVSSKVLSPVEEGSNQWWEEEIKGFNQKVRSFMIQTGDILGDRRFSKWKASVVDSIVGVFLTQNVSDYLSSSVFMLMAARYPVNLTRECDKSCEQLVDNSIHDVERITAGDEKSLESFEITRIQEPMEDMDKPQQQRRTSKTKNKGLGTSDTRINWDTLRTIYSPQNHPKRKRANTLDSVDWDAVRKASVKQIAKTIEKRGQQNKIAQNIKDFLDRIVKDHGSFDLEWLRDVPPEKAKEYLLDIHGLGLKSVECLLLLTLHHPAFPVDVNVGRIAVRLGWVPLQSLPNSQMNTIQAYLWRRLCHQDQGTLYELHYKLITIGKIFCTEKDPRCSACPLREECKHYTSTRLASVGIQQKISRKASKTSKEPSGIKPSPEAQNCESTIEEPPSIPDPNVERDIEDLFLENHQVSSNPTLKQQPSEYQVYELPAFHPLLKKEQLQNQESDPLYPYLLAIRTKDDQRWHKCEPDNSDEKTCSTCKCQENDHGIVPATLLIPYRTAMRNNFPLNGTYFQVNEVFVDDESSNHPIDVPRAWLRNLKKRTLYCGVSLRSMLKGFSTEQIQECFSKGCICIRAFNRETREPKSLPSIFHKRLSAKFSNEKNTKRRGRLNLEGRSR